MALSEITLVLNLFDGGGLPITFGSASFVPNVVLTDAADQAIITRQPVTAAFGPEGFPTVQLLPTDDPDLEPTGWAWQAAFNVQGGLASYEFALPAGPVDFTATHATPAVFTFTPVSGGLETLPDGTGVQLAGGSLPAGFETVTTYYVVAASGDTFQLSATSGGEPIASTSSGSGTLQVVRYSLSALQPEDTAPPQAGDGGDSLANGGTVDGPLTVEGALIAGGGFASAVQVLTTSEAIDGSKSTVFLNGPNLAPSLPDATAVRGKTITVKLTYPFTSGTLTTVGDQTIDGYPSYQMSTQYQWVTVQSDGSDWQVVGAKPGGLLTIPVASLPNGTASAPYSAQLTATGGWPDYTWSVKSGSLPTGVSLSDSGALSGTPSVAAASGFTVQVTDSVGATATVSLTITISGGWVKVQTGSIFNASADSVSPLYVGDTTAGNAVFAKIGGNGAGPVTTEADGWTILDGGGSGNHHAIAYKFGCAAAETPPVFSIAGASDSWAQLEEWTGGPLTASLDLQASSSDGAPAWTAVLGSLADFAGELLMGVGYWNGSNTGGDVALSSFLNSNDETIPSTMLWGGNAYGQYFGSVSGVSGPTGSTLEQVGMTLSVYAGGDGLLVSFKPADASTPPPPSVTTSSPLAGGSTDQPYNITLSAENGVPPYAWSLLSGSMPAGLTLSSGGVISGTPTVAATTSLAVEVTDTDSQTGSATLSLTIAETPAVTFTSSADQGTSQDYASPFSNGTVTGTTAGVNVNNNIWNPEPGATSTVYVVDPTDWWVIADFPAENTAVLSYPSLDCVFGDQSLSSFESITSSFSEEMNPTSGSQCWGAYDIWCNNWANEIMIHHDLARFNPYDDAPVAHGISFGGSGGIPELSFDLHLYGAAEYVWQPASGSWNEQSGSFDILSMLQWMVTNGFLPSVNTLTAIGYGWELCSTGGLPQFFKVSGFTMNAQYTAGARYGAVPLLRGRTTSPDHIIQARRRARAGSRHPAHQRPASRVAAAQGIVGSSSLG